jgi:hypothetical protein
VVIVNNWRIVGLFVFLTIAFFGFFLVVTLSYLVDDVIPPVDDIGTLSQATILSNDIVPWFFWIELCFVVIGVGVGLKIGSQTILESWKVVGGYIISAVAILGGSLYIALNYLVYNLIYQLAPPIVIYTNTGTYDTHTFIQSTILNGMIFSWIFWTAFCFVVAGVVMGLLGSQIGRET